VRALRCGARGRHHDPLDAEGMSRPSHPRADPSISRPTDPPDDVRTASCTIHMNLHLHVHPLVARHAPLVDRRECELAYPHSGSTTVTHRYQPAEPPGVQKNEFERVR
jgi:hypothetical protein